MTLSVNDINNLEKENQKLKSIILDLSVQLMAKEIDQYEIKNFINITRPCKR